MFVWIKPNNTYSIDIDYIIEHKNLALVDVSFKHCTRDYKQ
jgi:hypothetical protein